MGLNLNTAPPHLRAAIERALAKADAVAAPPNRRSGHEKADCVPVAARSSDREGKDPRERMNKAERAYESHLLSLIAAGEVRAQRFEAVKLRLGWNLHFTPDFRVVLADGAVEFHEVKAQRRRKSGTVGAHCEEDARVKIKVAAEMFPEWTFRLVSFNRQRGAWEFETIRPYASRYHAPPPA